MLEDFATLLINALEMGFSNPNVHIADIIATLLVTMLSSGYIFVIYRFISKRGFYNRSFNISLALVPIFIASIVMTLQLNIVITLGTIGALAIIRFRTAVKDPMDMVFILWAIHNGIVCGCGLFEIAFIVSSLATIIVLCLEKLPIKTMPYLLVINLSNINQEQAVKQLLSEKTKYYSIKSRTISNNFGGTKSSADIIVEVSTVDDVKLTQELLAIKGVENVSMIAHESENFL